MLVEGTVGLCGAFVGGIGVETTGVFTKPTEGTTGGTSGTFVGVPELITVT
jgi:hypothetical protein